ncbi:hypothetical protein Tco_1045409 [Tanacetum coccineum]|uniref:Uncharacterized protein n=1 Tax=Tanacetum coccineum TaxID=301880 RepID=A0ABQ5GT74_9ASTR
MIVATSSMSPDTVCENEGGSKKDSSVDPFGLYHLLNKKTKDKKHKESGTNSSPKFPPRRSMLPLDALINYALGLNGCKLLISGKERFVIMVDFNEVRVKSDRSLKKKFSSWSSELDIYWQIMLAFDFGVKFISPKKRLYALESSKDVTVSSKIWHQTSLVPASFRRIPRGGYEQINCEQLGRIGSFCHYRAIRLTDGNWNLESTEFFRFELVEIGSRKLERICRRKSWLGYSIRMYSKLKKIFERRFGIPLVVTLCVTKLEPTLLLSASSLDAVDIVFALA